MLHRVLTITLHTFREAVRARILLGLAGVAFAVSVFSLVIASFTLESAPRVVSDLGAGSISVFGIVVAIVIGATTLHRELEQKTIFPFLARPISRGEFLVGKYLGILLTIATFVAADTGLVLGLAASLGGRAMLESAGVLVLLAAALPLARLRWPNAFTFGPIPWALAMLLAGTYLCSVAPDEQRAILTQALLTFLEVAIVAAVAILMSSFSTPFLSSLFTLGVVLIGRSADSFARFPQKFFGPAVSDAAKVFGKMVPNLHLYVPPRPLLTGETTTVDPVSYVTLAAGTSLGWTVGLLAVAVIIFKRRDFL